MVTDDVADGACIAGAEMGNSIMIAVHCSNKFRVYFFATDTSAAPLTSFISLFVLY